MVKGNVCGVCCSAEAVQSSQPYTWQIYFYSENHCTNTCFVLFCFLKRKFSVVIIFDWYFSPNMISLHRCKLWCNSFRDGVCLQYYFVSFHKIQKWLHSGCPYITSHFTISIFEKKIIMSKTIIANGLSFIFTFHCLNFSNRIKRQASVVHLWKLVSQCSGHELLKCRSRYLVQKAGFFIFLFFFWWIELLVF